MRCVTEICSTCIKIPYHDPELDVHSFRMEWPQNGTPVSTIDAMDRVNRALEDVRESYLSSSSAFIANGTVNLFIG